jgi:hypothetical protein
VLILSRFLGSPRGPNPALSRSHNIESCEFFVSLCSKMRHDLSCRVQTILEQKATKVTKSHQGRALQTHRHGPTEAASPRAHPDRVELPAGWRDLLVRYRAMASRAEWGLGQAGLGSRDLVWIVARSRSQGVWGLCLSSDADLEV